VPYQAVSPPVAEQAVPVEDQPALDEPSPESDFGDPAVKAFSVGNYREAARLAQHWTVDAPQNAKAHELLSLALFAIGEYRGAAYEAHAALHFAPAADWPTLFRYYNDVERYDQQAETLAKYARENKDSADAQFLLGYHNLMMGHQEAARKNFTKALTLAPQDEVAREMVAELRGTNPPLPPPPVPLPPAPQNPTMSPTPPSSAADDIPPPEPTAAIIR
jgi:tetratricopeptide (TPR) repeat protein